MYVHIISLEYAYNNKYGLKNSTGLETSPIGITEEGS